MIHSGGMATFFLAVYGKKSIMSHEGRNSRNRGVSMKTLFLLLLLSSLPVSAFAADECCFRSPGVCSDISSPLEKNDCERNSGTVVLDSSCKESPECHLSEEPKQKPKEKP